MERKRIRSRAGELSCSRSHDCNRAERASTSVRAAGRKLVKLFKKPKSKFYWYDFTVRGRRYRGSTQETKSVRALQIASLKLASVMERTDPLPTKPAVLQEFADRFLDWVNDSRLEEKTRKFYRNGWRLLKCTSVAMLRVDKTVAAEISLRKVQSAGRAHLPNLLKSGGAFNGSPVRKSTSRCIKAPRTSPPGESPGT